MTPVPTSLTTPNASKTAFGPMAIGTVHFIGIGGIGMSGIAEILHHLGYKVQGSDLSENANVKRLRERGIPVSIGHKAENLGEAGVVVISSAVKANNPEVVAARAALLPVVRRAEMLGELMRLKWAVAVGGTHGKTTTTTMVASLFDAAGLNPTVINGGIINDYGTNARLGAGEWMIVESDESDGSFTRLPATITLITNIDAEHMDHYRDFDAVRAAYDSFVQNIPFYGFAVLCIDHPEVQAMIPRVSDRRIVTYGFNTQADMRGFNLRPDSTGTLFDVALTDRKTGQQTQLTDLRLPIIGQHNVQNALGALTIGWQLGFSEAALRQGLNKFGGVKRRFTRTGMVDGITIIDDYGHHPVEIMTTLKAARQAAGDGRVIAVLQPHRYSRLSSMFNEFCACCNDADSVIVADVYAAGETPIAGADRDALVAGLREHGHRSVQTLASPEALPQLVASLAQAGDFVICLGAGSISSWANALPEQLAELRRPAKAG
jgi:UDP-N-acetylmuramate--alanine ligase